MIYYFQLQLNKIMENQLEKDSVDFVVAGIGLHFLWKLPANLTEAQLEYPNVVKTYKNDVVKTLKVVI